MDPPERAVGQTVGVRGGRPARERPLPPPAENERGDEEECGDDIADHRPTLRIAIPYSVRASRSFNLASSHRLGAASLCGGLDVTYTASMRAEVRCRLASTIFASRFVTASSL